MDVTQLLLCHGERKLPNEEDPVQVPDDIIAAVEKSLESGEHLEIHEILDKRQINLRSRIIEEEGKTSRTILRKLLDDAVNGDRIVEQQLDKNVQRVGATENSLDFGAQIDFGGIFKEDSPRQTRVVKELLDLRASSSEGEQRDAYTRLISHPVVATFIHLKWKQSRWFFYINSAVFALFLILYSLYISHLFSRPEKFCQSNQGASDFAFPSSGNCGEGEEKEMAMRREAYYEDLSKKNTGILGTWESDGVFLVAEVFFFVLLGLLTIFEVYQASVLRLQYLKELENLIEWVVILSAGVTIMTKHILVDVTMKHSSLVRGIAAIGIGAAWMELIFIIGRYPFRGGDFSIMYYNIIRKTFRYVIAMGLMICGFAFAFMVINFGLEGDIFQSPWKSIMTTLTMTLGEFNFGDLYEAFGADVVSRGFAMFLLLLLIVLGTITMVNLFVVVIISDLTKLQQEVFHQSLVNMATASILVESLLPSKMLWRCRVPETVLLCSHTLCPAACQGLKLDRAQDMLVVKEGIKAVMKRKKGESKQVGDASELPKTSKSTIMLSHISKMCT